MNDRYLYRAKRIDNGEWVEGNLITDEQDEKKCFIGYVFGTNDDGTPHDFDVVAVDPSTICQRVPSGGCSLDEKPIWESDIVTDGRYIGVVRFGLYESKHLGFYIEWMNGNDVLRKDLCYWLPKIKAIGNIFDNQELLEVGE